MIYHTHPVNDIFDHITDGFGCFCSPNIVAYDDGDTHIIHNSIDGREHYEPDHDWSNCSVCMDELEA